MNTSRTWLSVCVVVGMLAGTAGALTMETVPVENPGNGGEWSGMSYGGDGPNRICGAVGYTYNIGKYEVMAGQYTEFLNAVAKTDTYGLYNPNMSRTDYGSGITQSPNGPGNTYVYSVASNFGNRPVNYVSCAPCQQCRLYPCLTDVVMYRHCLARTKFIFNKYLLHS